MIRALIFTLAAIAAGAQQPQRDTSSITPIRIGTASVSGVVTLGDDVQTPVRRAVVTLVSTDGVETRSTVSDDNGRFTIGGLPAGRYTLQALKPAHLTMAFGARRPGWPGTALVVADGQSIADLRLPLPRGAVLAGRLTLASGEPLANTQVQAIPVRLLTAGGSARAVPRPFQTDDLGEFRIYGLMSDTYVLAAIPAFGIGELQRRSEQDFDAIVRTLQQRIPTPAGKPAAARTDPLPPAEVVGYAPTYFPGTPIATDATPIVLRAGEVRDGLGFTVWAVPKVTISGTVLDAAGGPAPASYVSAELVGPPLAVTLLTSSAPRNSRPNARGEFSIVGVGPGRYRIRAHARSSTSPTEWALAEVNVSGGDIVGLTLTLQPGRVFSGTLLAESAAAPASWSGALVALQPTTGNPGIVLNGVAGTTAARATVGDDGRFAVTGLVPNDYEVRVTVPPALAAGGWTLASIRHRGRDVRDAPLTFNDGSVEGVEIVLTTAVTELAGRLTSASVAAATDYFVVAFPEDRGLWHAASPRIRVMRPAADGAFSTRDLPPGAYRLAALTDVDDDEVKRREFLESIYDAGVRVTVETGKRTMQELKIK